MNLARTRTLTIIAVLALAVGVTAVGRRTYAAGATLTPLAPAVTAGQTIQFGASGFRAGERMAIWATAPDGAVLGGDYVWASKDGTAVFGFDIPGEALGGRWAMTIRGDSSKALAIAGFDVAADPEAAPDNQVRISPAAGGPGAAFSVRAVGLGTSEKVSYWVTGPDGRVYSAYPSGERTNSRGELYFTWVAPADAPAGVSVITMQGLRTGRSRGVALTIVR